MYPGDYAGKLVEYCMVKIYSQIRVRETKQTWSEEDHFVLEKPQLKVEVIYKWNSARVVEYELCATWFFVLRQRAEHFMGCLT